MQRAGEILSQISKYVENLRVGTEERRLRMLIEEDRKGRVIGQLPIPSGGELSWRVAVLSAQFTPEEYREQSLRLAWELDGINNTVASILDKNGDIVDCANFYSLSDAQHQRFLAAAVKDSQKDN